MRGEPIDEGKDALYEFLNKTDLDNSVAGQSVGLENKHVSFAANQISQENRTTPMKILRKAAWSGIEGLGPNLDQKNSSGKRNIISNERRKTFRQNPRQSMKALKPDEMEDTNALAENPQKIAGQVDEKERFTKLLQDHIKKDHQFPHAIVYHDSEITTEKEAYIQRLLKEKPWLERSLLQWYNYEALKENFPLPPSPIKLQAKQREEFEEEIKFIIEKVVPIKEKARDLKTDMEFAYDLRYYGRYGDILLKRVKTRNYYQRLDLDKTCSDADVKSAYRSKALIWHSDNIKETFKYCFANESLYVSTTASIFSLIHEAYKTLCNTHKRTAYDSTLAF